MSWVSVVSPKARKELKGFPIHDVAKILDVIEDDMQRDPYGGDIVKLGGSDGWRRRIGSYRIKFLVETTSKTVHVFEIERRTSTTYRKKR